MTIETLFPFQTDQRRRKSLDSIQFNMDGNLLQFFDESYKMVMYLLHDGIQDASDIQVAIRYHVEQGTELAAGALNVHHYLHLISQKCISH